MYHFNGVYVNVDFLYSDEMCYIFTYVNLEFFSDSVGL